MTPDPFARSAHIKNPGSWNRYAFVNNDPINRNDPRGLNASGAGSGAGAGGAGGGSSGGSVSISTVTTYTSGSWTETILVDPGGSYEVTMDNSSTGEELIADFDSDGSMNEIQGYNDNGTQAFDMSAQQFLGTANSLITQINNCIAADTGLGAIETVLDAAAAGLMGPIVGAVGAAGPGYYAIQYIQAQKAVNNLNSWVQWVQNGGYANPNK